MLFQGIVSVLMFIAALFVPISYLNGWLGFSMEGAMLIPIVSLVFSIAMAREVYTHWRGTNK